MCSYYNHQSGVVMAHLDSFDKLVPMLRNAPILDPISDAPKPLSWCKIFRTGFLYSVFIYGCMWFWTPVFEQGTVIEAVKNFFMLWGAFSFYELLGYWRLGPSGAGSLGGGGCGGGCGGGGCGGGG